MNKEDLELIKKEFEYQKENNMQQAVITKGLIDELLNQYNKCCYTELYYDSEPDIEYEEFERLDKTYEGRQIYSEMVKEYDSKRKRFNNWCDPVEEGIWDFTMEQVRDNAKNVLTRLKKHTYKNTRFYIDYKQDKADLYFYGRDMNEYQMDYWFSFWNEE